MLILISMNEVSVIIQKFIDHRDERNIAGMARFGINASKAFGIKLPVLRDLAKPYRKNHELALELWKTELHEARLMAIFIDDPKKLTEIQMELWLKDFDSWDITDQACMNLFVTWPHAYEKVVEWSRRIPEFEKRAAFSLLAGLAVHDKKAPDEKFISLFPVIEKASDDNRNFVKKAVNWALRQIGKRNETLNLAAIACARRIQQLPSKSARWIAADALRELQSDAVQQRLRRG
jgi:3-methyladenine DNA glycosylase AlkD